MTQISVTQPRPGVFAVVADDFTATVDAEAYEPEVFVSYLVRPSDGCQPVYSRDAYGIIRINANGGHQPKVGEVDAVRALFDAADAYVDEAPCSCGRVRSAR